MWTVHLRYDDLLVAVAVVPLVRMVAAGRRGAAPDRPAAILLGLAAATIVMPASLLFPPAPAGVIEALQTLIWLSTLGFLAYRALAPRAADADPP
jgi:hypothetical protein